MPAVDTLHVCFFWKQILSLSIVGSPWLVETITHTLTETTDDVSHKIQYKTNLSEFEQKPEVLADCNRP